MRLSIFLLFFSVLACTQKKNTLEARRALPGKEYDSLLIQLAPYVVKRPDGMGIQERFEKKSRGYYENYLRATGGKIVYYANKDTAGFFSFEYRDIGSLYEHYRALGGYFKRHPETGAFTFLNILYHTPRFARDEMNAKAQVLFQEMVNVGNVDGFVGNRLYIQTPNDDFYYNTGLNIWDYTPNSSWMFLDEARKEAGTSMRDSLN